MRGGGLRLNVYIDTLFKLFNRPSSYEQLNIILIIVVLSVVNDLQTFGWLLHLIFVSTTVAGSYIISLFVLRY